MKTSISVPMVVSNHLVNAAGILPGSEILKLLGGTAGLVGFRYGGKRVVSALVGPVSFKNSVKQEDFAWCSAEIVCTGSTSMGIEVKIEVEKEGKKHLCVEGFWVMVAVNPEGKPQPIPVLPLDNPEAERKAEKAKQLIQSLRTLQ